MRQPSSLSRGGFARGLIVGAAVAAASLVGYAHGTTDADSPSASELESLCDVQVGLGRFTGGYQCRNDQVMVGIQGGNLLCADVTVSCIGR